jgi:hypothetical protein
MRGPIGTFFSIGAALCVLAAFGGAIYGLFLIGPGVVVVFGVATVIAGVLLVIIAHDEKKHRRSEHAALPARLAYLRQPVPAVTGPVLTPEPLPYVDIFTWVVRKEDGGRFAVFPMAKNGMELREHTLATGLPWDEAWDIRNREQRAIGK